MIGTMQIKCNAAHPQMALPTVCTYATSPSSIRVLEVPKKIGKWQITEVNLKALYPDGSIVAAPCVLVGGAWVGTLEGTTATGTVKNGFTVIANGVDENGDDVRGYVLGVGDIKVLELDANAEPDPQRTFIKLYSSIPDQLQNGDAWIDDNGRFSVQAGDDVVKSATVQEVNEVAGNLETKADKPATFTAGNLAKFDAQGNPVDSGAKASDKLDSEAAAPTFSTSPSQQYKAGDYCTYNGELYVCLIPTTGGTWDGWCWAIAELPKLPSIIIPNRLVSFGPGTTLVDSGVKPSDFQSALSTQQLANIAAVPDKLDKSGGIVTGPVLFNSANPVVGPLTLGFNADPELVENALDIIRASNGDIYLRIRDTTLADMAQLKLPRTSGTFALTSDIPYTLGTAITASAQLADRTNNYVAPQSGSDAIALTFPAATTGKARDFLILVSPGSSYSGSISFTAPTGATIYGDGFGATVTPGESWLFAITEIATNQFYTRAIKMEVPA